MQLGVHSLHRVPPSPPAHRMKHLHSDLKRGSKPPNFGAGSFLSVDPSGEGTSVHLNLSDLPPATHTGPGRCAWEVSGQHRESGCPRAWELAALSRSSKQPFTSVAPDTLKSQGPSSCRDSGVESGQ